MADFLWPVDIVPASQTWKVIDPAGQFQSPLSGSVRTVARAGARMGCTITVPPVKGQDRARVMAVLAGLRGRSNRIWMPDYSVTQRGSFAAPELLTNNTFANGTTGWTGGASGSIAVRDSVARITRTAAGEMDLLASVNSTVVQYAPMIGRSFVGGVSGGLGGVGMQVDDAGPVFSGQFIAGANNRMISGSIVPSTTSGRSYLYAGSTGEVAGDYFESPWMSLSRCAMVDNGPNALLYSDQFDNVAWTKSNATVAANGGVAPDGTTTADALQETATTATHGVLQAMTVSSSAVDVTFSICVVAATRSWCYIQLTDNVAHFAGVYVNLAAGTFGSVGASGSNITNARYTITDMGGGWRRITLTVRKSGSQTAVYPSLYAATGDGAATYAGTGGATALYLWRGSAAISSVPVVAVQTTTTATTGTAQNGSRLNLKGLPASTQGLLRAGDPVQIGNQINFVTASLDSNAAGLGVLQCALPWRQSPADNDPVIINKPMAKMLLAGDSIDWETGPGQFSPFTIELVEDVL